jgi:hypothetical protein
MMCHPALMFLRYVVVAMWISVNTYAKYSYCRIFLRKFGWQFRDVPLQTWQQSTNMYNTFRPYVYFHPGREYASDACWMRKQLKENSGKLEISTRNLMLGWPCILNYRSNNQHDALFIFSLLSCHTSTCFGRISSPSSGGRMYICGKWYWLYCTVDCHRAWPDDNQLRSITGTICTYIHSTRWSWTADAPETRRGVITQETEDKKYIVLVIIHILLLVVVVVVFSP